MTSSFFICHKAVYLFYRVDGVHAPSSSILLSVFASLFPRISGVSSAD